MTVVYWDPAEFDCPLVSGSSISDERTIHLHVASEEAAVEAYLAHIEMAKRSLEAPGGSLVGAAVGQRYCCIRAPKGLIRRIDP